MSLLGAHGDVASLSSAGAWTPAALDLTGWFDGTQSTFASGVWQDLSGLGNNAIVAGGSPSLDGDGMMQLVSAYFSLASGLIPTGTGQNYVLAFVVSATVSATGYLYAQGGSSSGDRPHFGRNTSQQVVQNYFGFSLTSSTAAMPITGAKTLVVFVFTANRRSCYVNGTQVINETTDRTTFGATNSDRQLGAGSASTTSAWNGKIGSVVGAKGASAVADRQKLEGYLAWKWGIQASLPAGHPYKTTAP